MPAFRDQAGMTRHQDQGQLNTSACPANSAAPPFKDDARLRLADLRRFKVLQNQASRPTTLHQAAHLAPGAHAPPLLHRVQAGRRAQQHHAWVLLAALSRSIHRWPFSRAWTGGGPCIRRSFGATQGRAWPALLLPLPPCWGGSGWVRPVLAERRRLRGRRASAAKPLLGQAL